MRLLIWIIILGFIFWYFSRKKRIKENDKKSLVTELVFDENCKTYIKKDKAIKVDIKGKTYYFCSKRCLEEFLKKI
ncbi:YHS domain-containing protein [Thermodesulfobacterium hydrogeniphilum]|uniref:YHS domain-containing protein n=1 Tax=Thermodesulfobacterium hydrogeniphilum TaxID=161156 RepID=UPI0005700274|nr:YHS domain-containing protein [Thermodesulfobacterium hydrogeniphilum]